MASSTARPKPALRANCGTIYKVSTGGTLTTLYAFKDVDDGSNPASSLVVGPSGVDFCGPTPMVAGGHGQGSVFRVSLTGVLTTIHNFSALDSNLENADGADPEAAVLVGSDGNFYGTTAAGGANGGGTIFQIRPGGALTTLYNFASPGSGTFYGPRTALAAGSDGNLYGTAQGGSSGYGVIFKVTPAGAVTLLHTFTGGTDGAYAGRCSGAWTAISTA